jgi:hypothetical protein
MRSSFHPKERERKRMRHIPVYVFCSFVKRTNALKVAPKPHKHTNERTKWPDLRRPDVLSRRTNVARSLARSIRQSSTHEESEMERKSSAGSRIAVAVVGPLSRTIAFWLTKFDTKIFVQDWALAQYFLLFSFLQEEFLHSQFVALTVVGILTFSEMIASSFCGRWKLEIEQEGRAGARERTRKQMNGSEGELRQILRF